MNKLINQHSLTFETNNIHIGLIIYELPILMTLMMKNIFKNMADNMKLRNYDCFVILFSRLN